MGFGTCCIFFQETCNGEVSENCTYVRNEGFPTARTSTGTTQFPNCQYTINKCSTSVSTLRIDFNTFNILAGTTALDATSGPCRDSFTVSQNPNGANHPVTAGQKASGVICGLNTGQHMYIEVGEDTSAAITFAFGAVAGSRTWELKITQYEATSPVRPPDGCLQYHTGTEGSVQTFNFANAGGNHLHDQNYNICIRQEMGFRCIQYTECAGQANAYTLSPANAVAMGKGLTGTSCVLDYIVLAGSSPVCSAQGPLVNKYCGDTLTITTDMVAPSSSICDCTPPFEVGIRTNAMAVADTNARASRGLCLDYQQIP